VSFEIATLWSQNGGQLRYFIDLVTLATWANGHHSYISCVSIFTASTENLQCTLYYRFSVLEVNIETQS